MAAQATPQDGARGRRLNAARSASGQASAAAASQSDSTTFPHVTRSHRHILQVLDVCVSVCVSERDWILFHEETSSWFPPLTQRL